MENFLSIGKSEVHLSDRGFTLVSGINNETDTPQSNGSGKSSMFDAILWTITGETSRGASSVVNEKSTTGCKCSLVIVVDDKQYTIIRSKNHSELGTSCYVYCDDDLLSDQTKKSQELISNLIPISSSNILGSIVLLGQGLPYKFSSLSPIKRKELLEVMSGSSSKIDNLKYLLSIEDSKYSDEYSKLDKSVIKLESEVSSMTNSVSVLEGQKVLDLDKAKEDMNVLTSEISELESKINEYSNRSSELSTELPKYESALDQVNKYKYKILSDIDAYKSQLSSIKTGNCPTCGRPFDNQEGNSQRVIDINSSIQSKTNELSAIDAKITGLSNKIQVIKDKISNYNNVVVSCNHNIEINKNKVDIISSNINKATELDSEIKKIKDNIVSNNVMIHDNKEKLDEVSSYMECVSYINRQLSRDFKGYMLTEVINLLSSRAAHYSEYLFNNNSRVNVELSGSKVNISVGSRYYENLSGGERQRVDLAVQFALRDVLSISSGFSCNLLVLDEAFDNLDESGSESLVRLVSSEFSDIDSLFIITHHADISVPYDNVITVVKDKEGISTITER